MSLRDLWRRITTPRYTRALEMEVARLRAENHALLNSILGIAGIPPVPVIAPDPVLEESSGYAFKRAATEMAPSAASAAEAPGAKALRGAGNATARLKPCPDGPVPMRRRSWHQINRMLELASARKKSQEA